MQRLCFVCLIFFVLLIASVHTSFAALGCGDACGGVDENDNPQGTDCSPCCTVEYPDRPDCTSVCSQGKCKWSIGNSCGDNGSYWVDNGECIDYCQNQVCSNGNNDTQIISCGGGTCGSASDGGGGGEECEPSAPQLQSPADKLGWDAGVTKTFHWHQPMGYNRYVENCEKCGCDVCNIEPPHCETCSLYEPHWGCERGGTKQRKYQLCFSRSSDKNHICGAGAFMFETYDSDTTIFSTLKASITFDATGKFYWTVRAFNKKGVGTLKSSLQVWSFTVYVSTTIPPLPPSDFQLDSMVIQNNEEDEMTADSSGRNQICETDFNDSRQVRFVVALSKADVGGSGIKRVDLSLQSGGTEYLRLKADNLNGVITSSITGAGASYYSNVTTSANGDLRTVTFPVEFNTDFQGGNFRTYNLLVYGEDVNGNKTVGTNNLVDAGRDFRVWDCQVPLAGSVYDSSAAGGAVCATGAGFSDLATMDMNFSNVEIKTGGTDTIVNAVNGNTYSSAPIIWGKDYIITPNADLKASGVVTRWIDLGTDSSVGNTGCGTEEQINNDLVDPYTINPSLQVDFSAIKNQNPWFQVSGGGVMAKTKIEAMTPVTCVFPCQPAISINSADGDNGLVAAPMVTNSSGCPLESCSFYGMSPNDWGYEHNIINDSYGYHYFYNNYYAKTGAGAVIASGTSMSQITGAGIGGTGVVLVKGDFTIDADNIVDVGKFLMVVASGKITIDQSVTQTEGILVADQGIGVSGANDNQLKINGVVYAAGGNVSFVRGYTTPAANDTSPGVLVTYRPDLIFNLPPTLIKVLTSWSQGR